MRYDTTLKELFHSPPQRLLQMLVGGEAKELLSVEYPAVSMRRPDLVVRLTDGRLYHLELQSSNDASMALRMAEYYILIKRQYRQSPVQQVLYVGNEAVSLPGGINDEHFQFSYRVIDIRELDSKPLLESKVVEDNLLAILCRVEEARVIIKMILERIAELSGKTRSDLLAKLLVLAGLRNWQALVTEEAKQMAITIDIMENPFLKEVFEEGEQKGIEKGIDKGESALLRRQLERRHGPLPEWVESKLESADRETLERWGLQLLEATSLEEALK